MFADHVKHLWYISNICVGVFWEKSKRLKVVNYLRKKISTIDDLLDNKYASEKELKNLIHSWN